MAKVISADQAAKLIRDGDVCGFTTQSISGYCQEVGDAIARRYLAERKPRGITVVHACGSGLYKPGDRWGINGLAHEGLIDTIISGHIGGSPDICDLIARNAIKSYLIPQGIVTHLYRAQGNGSPGVITKVGMATYADPRLEGCRANEVTREEVVTLLELDGEEWLRYKIAPINVAVIQATTADEHGNLTNEHASAQFELLPLAMAAHNNGGIVIAQVERMAAAGSMKNVDVRVPGMLVDYVVIAQEGNQPQTEAFDYQPGLSGELKVPVGSIAPMELSARKVIARRAAMLLRKGMIVNIGIGIPDGIGSVAAEEGISDAITITTELGSIGGVPGYGHYFGAAFNAEAYLRHYEMFDFYDGGGLDISFLGMAQADPGGNINVSKIGGKPNGPGGFLNIIQSAKHIVFLGTLAIGAKFRVEGGRLHVEAEGRPGKFVETLSQVSFSGRYAQQQGKEVTYVTERCVFELRDGLLTLTELAEGMDLERDIFPLMGFRPALAETIAPMPRGIFRESWHQLREIMESNG